MAAGSLSAGTLVFCDLVFSGVPPGDLSRILKLAIYILFKFFSPKANLATLLNLTVLISFNRNDMFGLLSSHDACDVF